MAVCVAAVFSYRDTDTELDATVDATIDDDNIVLASAINCTKKDESKENYELTGDGEHVADIKSNNYGQNVEI